MLRFFDISFSLIGLIISSPALLLIYSFGLLDTGYPIFIQKRLGKKKIPFNLIKFRTMHVNTEDVATHLASKNDITKFGKFLRKTKLDELPQLINVLKGEMSFVGPRPNLLNQIELIRQREIRGVYDVLPGITGIAQVNKIDMSDAELLAKIDSQMIKSMSFLIYFKLIFKTIMGSGLGDRIKS